jgi:hypothetical protein
MRGAWVAAVIVTCTASACGADLNTRVKSRAAHDIACNEADTRIVDAAEGVYRVTGCGMVVGYQCSENAYLHMHCEQIYLSKAPDAESAPKAEPGANLAKTN